jgi:hypothetical protein
MLTPVVIALGALILACLGLDLALRRVKFRRADEKTEKFVKKYRYTGW